jgi:hypothetical protein
VTREIELAYVDGTTVRRVWIEVGELPESQASADGFPHLVHWTGTFWLRSNSRSGDHLPIYIQQHVHQAWVLGEKVKP